MKSKGHRNSCQGIWNSFYHKLWWRFFIFWTK